MADDVQAIPADLARIPSLFDLNGKTALVTGAASGLGRAIAIGLAVHGADVVTADLNLEGAQATSEMIRDLGRRTATIAVDVTDWDQVQRMVEQAEAALGQHRHRVQRAGHQRPQARAGDDARGVPPASSTST